jgi:UDP-glucose 4-epimerase
VGLSLLAPEEDFRRSVLASAELLEWARLSAKDANLVLVSSAAVYGAGHSKPILESEAVAPYSPYGYNKRISEELFESYSKNFGLNVAIVRLFSVYGQELRKQLLWDSCCRLLNDDKSLLLGGTGKEVRDWFHVQDAVELIQLAANFARKDCLIVNGGAGIPMSVREIAEALCDSWGSATSPVFSGTVRAGDPHYLVADMNLAMTLGFEPVISWQTGVSNYVEWFKQVNIKAV